VRFEQRRVERTPRAKRDTEIEPVNETHKPAEVKGHSDASSRESSTLDQVEEALKNSSSRRRETRPSVSYSPENLGFHALMVF